ncbi:MAG: protein translocase subunit SecF, partial [Candidatus Marinimicrobia bacterium]|nr:protein translocase subunit SecF [Candidatus Neomarinimicrobiota bacterium]
LSRTIITSLTTFFVVLILYLVGGEVIHTFAFAMIVGVIIGTYSSIFIASPVLIKMGSDS